jgi:two-component system, sensor histidine kinase
VTVGDGADAVAAFEQGGLDLVLMDLQTPVMDGLTATRRICELERRSGRVRTPVLVITANTLLGDVEASLKAGADRHLPNPLMPLVLLEAVAQALT